MLTIAYYEFIRMIRSRATLLLNIGLPLLLILILGTALSDAFQAEDQEINQVKTVIYSEDVGAMQEAFTAFLSSEGVEPYISPVHVDERDDVEAMLSNGDADFGLIIPRDFSESVFSGQVSTWEFISGKSELNNMTASMVLNSFVQQTNRMQAQALVLGAQTVDPTGQSANTGLQNQQTVIIGSLQQQETTSAVQYYAASMLIMFLLFSGMACAISLTTESENHTLSRLNAMPLSPIDIIGGKLLGNLILAILQATIIIVFSDIAYGVDWGSNKLAVVAICLLTIIAAMSLALLLSAIFKTSKSVTAIYQTFIFAATFLSGGMAVGLGDLIHQIGKFTINHWAASGLLRIMLNSDFSLIMQDIGVLGAIASGLFIVAIVSYRKVGYHE